MMLRHRTLTRLHHQVGMQAGVECDRAGYLVMRRIVSEGPIRVTDLAREVGVEPSTVSRHLQAIEARGWVRRLADAEDRRAALFEATRAGKEVVVRMERERRRVLAAVLEGWDQADRDALLDLTERYANELAAYVEDLP